MQQYRTDAFKVSGHPGQTRFGCVSRDERGMDPSRRVPPWAMDPSVVLPAAILPLRQLGGNMQNKAIWRNFETED